MNGPSHYLEAQSILHKATAAVAEDPTANVAAALAAAQVHATLALASAAALGSLLEGEEAPWKTRMNWAEVVL